VRRFGSALIFQLVCGNDSAAAWARARRVLGLVLVVLLAVWLFGGETGGRYRTFQTGIDVTWWAWPPRLGYPCDSCDSWRGRHPFIST